MNIFFLHSNPRKCARWHCDKHVVKMLLETCQLLYTCHWMMSGGNPDFSTAPLLNAEKGELKQQQRGYKKAHWNHPCSKWLRVSLFHYVWLAELGKELLREYRFRYKGRNHKCGEHIEWLAANYPSGLENKGWCDPFLAMPDIYKCGDAIASYRRYYIGAKSGFLNYTGRAVPHWISRRQSAT
jgi:hypothetical protein